MGFWRFPRRILVLEDREEDYRVFRSLLGEMETGHIVAVRVSDVSEAEKCLRSEYFDLILSSYGSGDRFPSFWEVLHFSPLPPIILIVNDSNVRKELREKKIPVSDILLKDRLNADVLERAVRLSIERNESLDHLNLLKMGIERSNDIFLITEASPIDEPGPRIVYVNEAFERLTGYKRGEVLGKTPRILQGPRTDRKVLDRIREAISEGKPCFEEIVNYDKDGNEYWIEMDIFPIVNDKGVTTHLMGIERDITVRRLTEERLRQSQKMEAVGELAGGMAHDFNNLLNVILANLDLLELKLQDSPELLKRVSSAQGAIQRGVELNKRLLAFSRKQALNPEPTDVNRVLREFIPILDRIRTDKVTIEYELSEDSIICDIEKTALENAVLNLALNARDSMPDGGKIYISSGFIRNGDTKGSRIAGLGLEDYFLVSVTDTGTGMNDEIKARIFDPFFSTKGGGKGTGLGLTMVYGFVKQSNGFLKVITVPDYGSSFLIFLPVYKDVSHSIQRKHTVNGKKYGKVLVIEENRESAELVGVYLREFGFEPMNTSDSKRLAGFFSGDSDISFVLLDLQWAKNRGIDITKELTRFGAQKIILSSAQDPADPEIPRDVPFIRKPYTKSALRDALQKIGETLP